MTARATERLRAAAFGGCHTPSPLQGALLIALVLGGCAPASVPVVAFNLAQQWIVQPVLRLTGDDRLEGAAAFVLADAASPQPLVVAPSEVWAPSVTPSSLPGRLDHLEIYALDARGTLLGSATHVFGDPGGLPSGTDYGSAFTLFALDGSLDPSVHALALESAPAAVGDVYFVVGCHEQQAPCEQDTHAVDIEEVSDGFLRGQPRDFAGFHAFAGSPLVTPDGHVVGMLGRRVGAGSPDLLFIPATAIRARLDAARGH